MDAASDGMVPSKADHTLERALANGSALVITHPHFEA